MTMASALPSTLLLYPPTLVLHLLMDYLQGLKGHHGSDSSRDSADHISAHTIVKGSPTLFLEYHGTSADDASVARRVDHAVG
jgi:hypothetical protein